jgi:hypothetical protein
MITLIVPLPLLRDCLQRLVAGEHSVRVGLGSFKLGSELRFAARRGPLNAAVDQLLVVLAENLQSDARTLPDDARAMLVICRGLERGQAEAWVRVGSSIQPIDRIDLPGAGMHAINLFELESSSNTFDVPNLNSFDGRLSRTIAALTPEVFDRLKRLSYLIPGGGRSGSHLIAELYRSGAENLTICDPDRLEEHNLSEMAVVSQENVGELKTSALARSLMEAFPESSPIKEVRHSITHLFALQAAKHADVIITTVDHDSARLAASIIAALFAKVHLDIGTGIRGLGGQRVMGADVRLFLPGESCVLCLGGLRNESEARRVLASADEERRVYSSRDWRRERTGSLASLNVLAVNLALRLWEDFVAERIEESTWTHAEFNPHGRLSVSYPADPSRIGATNGCPLCALAGLGDSGLAEIPSFLLPSAPQASD